MNRRLRPPPRTAALGILFCTACSSSSATPNTDSGPPDSGPACPLAVACPLATSLDGPRQLAIDETNVYWVVSANDVDGSPVSDIVACAKTGCGGTPRVLQTIGGSGALAVDSTNLYWSDDLSGSVLKMPTAGGMPVTIATGQPGIYNVAVDGRNVYWVAQNGGDASLVMVPIGGGAPTTLVAGPLVGGGSLKTNGASVYLPSVGGFTGILKVAIAGGAVTTLAANAATNFSGMAIDTTNVYWTTYASAGSPQGTVNSTGTVMSVPLGGGAPTMLAAAQAGPRGVAVDTARVYWTNDGTVNGGGSVVAAPLTGGPSTTLASGQTLALEVVADATGVYWIDFGSTPGHGDVIAWRNK